MTLPKSYSHPAPTPKELHCAENSYLPPRNPTTLLDKDGNQKPNLCNRNPTLGKLKQKEIELEGRLSCIRTMATNMHPSRDAEVIKPNTSLVNVHWTFASKKKSIHMWICIKIIQPSLYAISTSLLIKPCVPLPMQDSSDPKQYQRHPTIFSNHSKTITHHHKSMYHTLQHDHHTTQPC